MAFLQYEVWGITDQHEELIECVPTLKEAEEIAEHERPFCDEVYILKDEDGFDLVEVKRYKGL
jgi:hypothetical protein